MGQEPSPFSYHVYGCQPQASLFFVLCPLSGFYKTLSSSLVYITVITTYSTTNSENEMHCSTSTFYLRKIRGKTTTNIPPTGIDQAYKWIQNAPGPQPGSFCHPNRKHVRDNDMDNFTAHPRIWTTSKTSQLTLIRAFGCSQVFVIFCLGGSREPGLTGAVVSSNGTNYFLYCTWDNV